MKIYLENRNNVLTDLEPFLDITTNLLEADIYLTWNDLIEPQKTNINEAKLLGKPVIVVEHGMKAVSDYQSDLVATFENMGGRALLADYILVWGDKSREILLKAGIQKEKIYVVGSPIIWENEYIYKNQNNEFVTLGFFHSELVVDPRTNQTWKLQGCRSYIPRNETGGKIVGFYPHHDYNGIGMEGNRLVWNQIKHRDDVFICLPQNYVNEEKENPFKELLDLPVEIKSKKAIALNIESPKSIAFHRKFLQKVGCIVSTIPGTINGLCWAINAPIINPRIDWGWRDLAGNVIYDNHSGDYVCNIDKLNKKIDSVLKKDTKQKQREKCAIDFMGVKKGHSRTNMIAAIKEIYEKHCNNTN